MSLIWKFQNCLWYVSFQKHFFFNRQYLRRESSHLSVIERKMNGHSLNPLHDTSFFKKPVFTYRKRAMAWNGFTPPPKEFIWEHNDSGKFAGLFEVSKNWVALYGKLYHKWQVHRWLIISLIGVFNFFTSVPFKCHVRKTVAS